jgi:mRNA interferase YafQ
MSELVKSKRFNAELYRAFRDGLDVDDWGHLEYLFLKGESLPPEYDEHRLTDNWEGYWDCHLAGDLVVVYKRTAKKVLLMAIGTHAELFPDRKTQRRKRGIWGWLKRE